MLAEKPNIPPLSVVYASSHLLEKALSVLQDGICIVDRKASFLYVNASCQNFLEAQSGRRPHAGDCLLDFVGPGRLEAHKDYLAKAFEGQTPQFEFAFYHNGNERWLKLEYYPMPPAEGEEHSVCIRSREITEKMILKKKLDEEQKNQQKKILKATIEAEKKQRQQIGRELHDNVNQVLTTVKLYAELCLSEEKVNPSLLEQIATRTNYCIEEIRNLSRKLSAPSVEDQNLEDLMQELVESVRVTQKIVIRYRSAGIKGKILKPEVQIALYRIAQEQFTNILKYAEASIVDVILVLADNVVAMQIQDNGKGFEYDENLESSGIANMIDRAESAGGRIEFFTAPGSGCCVTVEFNL